MQADNHGQPHVPTRTYVLVGLFLAVMTALEIAVPYTAALKRAMVPILLFLGAVKFVTVAAFFMHLKFDRKVLSWVFGAGVFLATALGLALMVVLRV